MSHDELLRRLNETEQDLHKANEIIIDLETKIAEMVSLSALSGTEKVMLDIIEREIVRINENTVLEKMSKDDLRKFDTLTKNFVAIRGKIVPPKSDDVPVTQEDEENLILIATNKVS